jgi:hypothetical protein
VSLESALGSQIADLLARGIDPAVISRAARELEGDLRRLRDHRARLLNWSAARSTQAVRAERLVKLANSAQQVLPPPSPPGSSDGHRSA